ncbi:MAG: VWA domain-containing protein, partial [Candidatus Rokubacteria bacterium]|nr:VWA domain-containing protein [Candidatus Rokubacteria bacterium]
MQFIWPTNLYLALAVPILLALYIWAQRRRQKFALRYASLSLVKEAMGKGPGVRRHIPPALFLLAIACMAVGLSRPQAVVTIPTNQGTIVLAMDVSGSMLSTDVKPNRLEAAKAAAKAFVAKQSESVKIGVVSFASDASIVQTPTTNKELVIAAINRLRPQRATAIGKGILVSLDAIAEDLDEGGPPPSSILTQPGANPGATNKPKRTAPPGGIKSPATIVLLTDGQNNQFPPPLAVLDPAIERGIRIYTIGLG